MRSPLNPQEYQTFCEFIYQHTGLRFTVDKRYFVDRRLNDSMKEAGTETFSDYFALLTPTGSHERQRLINRLTVNETSFLRESQQLQCLTDHLLPDIQQQHAGKPTGRRHRSQREVRIWCIPCSSGEEPYSISMYLREHLTGYQEEHIKLMASDINTEILEHAREGLFGEHTLRRLPSEWREKYFSQVGHLRQISEDIRSRVHFTRINLHCRKDMEKMSDIDIIFCRNLLIYFDATSQQQAADLLYRSLAPGGFLCLGQSESLNRFRSPFLTRKFGTTYVLQKPMA